MARDKVTNKDVVKWFLATARVMSWNIKVWDQLGRANVGAFQLNYTKEYGGYEVVKITTKGGGEMNFSGTSRLSAREMICWFQGVQVGSGHRMSNASIDSDNDVKTYGATDKMLRSLKLPPIIHK